MDHPATVFVSMHHLLIVHDTLAPLDLSLVLDFVQSVLQIMARVAVLGRADDDPRRIFEQIVHLFERTARRLREKNPEEDSVGEVANDEEEVEAIADVGHGDGRDLADHGVEREAGHGGDTHALAAGVRVEDFGGDDPT